MNKTININLAGIVFYMDENAFYALDNYLNQLKLVFKNTEGRDEIITDIEARFAELFRAELSEAQTVVTLAMVDGAIEILGRPEMFAEDDSETESDNSENFSKNEKKQYRKLFRDPEDTHLGGVCSGLAHYFGSEAWVFRVVFILMVLFGIGSGILIYIVLWIAVPEAKTTAQKLQMKGEPITASNIGKSVQEQFENLKNSVKNGETKNNLSAFFNRLGNFLLSVLTLIFNSMGKILGVFMLIAGIAILFMVLFSAFGMGSAFLRWTDQEWYSHLSFGTFSDLVLINQSQSAWILISLCVILLIPIFQIIYGSLRILFKIDKLNSKIGWVLTIAWVLGLITFFGNMIQLGMEFSEDARVDVQKSIPLYSDTLVVSTASLNNMQQIDEFSFFVGESESAVNRVEFDIKRSSDSLAYLVLVKKSQGFSSKDARERAKKIAFNYSSDGQKLILDDFIQFSNSDKYRAQQIECILYVPVGTSVYLDEGTQDIIHDIDNLQDIWNRNMPNHHWNMTLQGLSCTDCLIP